MFDGVVATRHGSVRGVEEGGIWSFRGLRYAAPTGGAGRFRPPSAPDGWSGVREAKEFGPIAAQPRDGIGSYVPGDPQVQDEDCCSLNVWTAGPDTATPRPVLVFIHGGAFITGSGSGVMYRGEQLARRGVVLVTCNYRLGALGFLAHPALADGHRGFGNWGLADQLAALAWVRDNIAAFGGDPANVTVFGESAGAMSVADHLGRPGRLFRRAIAESGAVLAASAAAATTIAERLAAELGLRGVDRDALAGVPIDELLGAQARIVADVDHGIGLPFQPVVDGGLLDRHPADAIAGGLNAGAELVIGWNRDEFRVFAYGVRNLDGLDDKGVAALVGRYLRGGGLEADRLDAGEVLALYRSVASRAGTHISSRALLETVATDWLFRIPALRLASAHAAAGGRAFAYRFDWESPFLGGALGACHGIELPFVFGTFEDQFVGLFAGTGEDAAALSDALQSAWVAFATAGDPSCEALGRWPAYDPSRRATMVLGRAPHLEDAPDEETRAFWDARLGRYGEGGPIEGAAARSVALLADDLGEADTGT